MDAMWDARLTRQPFLGSTRLSGDGSGLGFLPTAELPPLRDNPALSPIAHTPVRELDFLCDSLRSDVKTPGGRLSLRTPTVRTGGRLSQSERSESANSACDDRATAHEIEHLKKQVTRLTQLRRDRDNYIQDLLAEAEATRRRHEGEIQRSTVRSQREASERLSAQQREHDLHLEERSRAHAGALGQQASQHEREIEELRKSLRIDAERRIAERHTDAANQHRDLLQRLHKGIDDLRQRLASHEAPSGDSPLSDIMKDASAKPEARAAATGSRSSSRRPDLSSSSASIVEPEPEETLRDGPTLASHDAAEYEARAERSANELAEAVERTMTLARKDLECLLKAGKLVTEHAASTHECQPGEASQFDEKLRKATARLENEKCKFCQKTKDYAASAATANSQTLLLKVLLVWGDEVRRVRSLAAEQQRVSHKRQQRQPLILARIHADVDQWLHIVFRTWVRIFQNGRREVAEQVVVKQLDQQVAEHKAQLRTNVVLACGAEIRWLQQLSLHAWVAASRSSKKEASHQTSLAQATLHAATEAAVMRTAAARDALTLRLKRRSQGIQNINADLENARHALLQAWLTVTKAAHSERSVQEQFTCWRKDLGISKKTQGHLIAQAAVEHTEFVFFGAWAAARLVTKCEAEGIHRLDAVGAKAAAAKAEMELRVQGLSARRSGELRMQGLRLGRVHAVFQKRMMLLRWALATREARREVAHRHQLLSASADASAEDYKLRGDGKKLAVELRKQRRAHGVAAIHANLDRRLQSVFLAWGQVIRDDQREATIQRQLDIAAAESAAGCAVLRMEGRRIARDLRGERRAQALRAIDAGIRHWQHLALREWWAQASDARRNTTMEEALQEERRQAAIRLAEAEARHRTELHDQSANCEARVSSTLSTAQKGAETVFHQVELQHAADLCARDASAEAKASEVVLLCAERETLQAQIAKLHDELRRNEGQH